MSPLDGPCKFLSRVILCLLQEVHIVLHQQSPRAIFVYLKMAKCVFHLKWLLTAKPNLWLGCHYTATAGPSEGILSNTGGARGGDPDSSDLCVL